MRPSSRFGRLLLGVFSLVLLSYFWVLPAHASVQVMSRTVCATADGSTRQFQVGWNTGVSFFDGKGNIGALFCQIASNGFPVWVSSSHIDGTPLTNEELFYNGIPNGVPIPQTSPSVPNGDTTTEPTATPEPTVTSTVTPTVTPEPTPEPTVTPEPTPSSEPSVSTTSTADPSVEVRPVDPVEITHDYRVWEGQTLSAVAPAGTLFQSVSAWYGSPTDALCGADVSTKVGEYFLGLAFGEVVADNGIFGDSCPGVVKVLWADFSYAVAPVKPSPTASPTDTQTLVVEPSITPTATPTTTPEPEPTVEPTPEPTVTVRPKPVVTPEPVVSDPIPDPAPVVVDPLPIDVRPSEPPVTVIVSDPIPDPIPDPTVEPTPSDPSPEPMETATPTPPPSPQPTASPSESTPVPDKPTPTPVEPTQSTPEATQQPTPPSPEISQPTPIVIPDNATPAQIAEAISNADATLATAEQGSPEYAQALEVLAQAAVADDPEVPTEIANIPGVGVAAVAVLKAFNALGNIGADMAPAVRARSKKVVTAAVILTNIAAAASTITARRRK